MESHAEQGVYGIGQLSKESGCKVTTIRWYEKEGLLDEPLRSAGNQRRYSAAHLARLLFLRRAKDLGFGLTDVRQLIHLEHCRQHDPHEADAIANAHLVAVRDRIAQLRAMEVELAAILAGCEHRLGEPCRVIATLATPKAK